MAKQDTHEPALFNDQIKKEYGSNELYFTALLEQWKTANEQATNISAQRNNINNFYISLLSLLIGGILLSDRLMAEQAIARTVMLALILAVGIACCVTWVKQVDKCKRINYQKYTIIGQLEKQLPANVLSFEGSIPCPSDKKPGKQSKALSDYEKNLAFIFGLVISLITVTMLVETWWPGL